MFFSRRHKWKKEGLTKAGTVLASGIEEGNLEPTAIVSLSDFHTYHCQKCGLRFSFVGGDGRPPFFGCKPTNKTIYITGVTLYVK